MDKSSKCNAFMDHNVPMPNKSARRNHWYEGIMILNKSILDQVRLHDACHWAPVGRARFAPRFGSALAAGLLKARSHSALRLNHVQKIIKIMKIWWTWS